MNSSSEMNGGAVKIEGLDDLRRQSGPSLEGYIHAVWIPTLKDFPVCGLRLMVSDPLANQANLTAKVLDV